LAIGYFGMLCFGFLVCVQFSCSDEEPLSQRQNSGYIFEVLSSFISSLNRKKDIFWPCCSVLLSFGARGTAIARTVDGLPEVVLSVFSLSFQGISVPVFVQIV
jgi:hypothetical protein